MTTDEAREHYRFGLFGGPIPNTRPKWTSLIDVSCTLILDDEIMLTDGMVTFGNAEGMDQQSVKPKMLNRDPDTPDWEYVTTYRETLITTLEKLGYPRANLQGQVYVEWVNPVTNGEQYDG